jgi:FkbM family methyltransferase
MLINFDYLVTKYNLLLTGILHIGAHECEEIIFYDKYLPRDKVLWIEAMEDKVNFCKRVHSGVLIEHAVVSDISEPVSFNITNNGQSSSILELDKHLIHHPDIHIVKKFETDTTETRDVLKKYDIKFNFINLDIQGVELKALKGMEEYLSTIDYIYTEVNTAYLYKGCALLNEIDEYLEKFGFKRVETSMTGFEWGDAFYVNKVQ